jgi:hypothetical protein
MLANMFSLRANAVSVRDFEKYATDRNQSVKGVQQAAAQELCRVDNWRSGLGHPASPCLQLSLIEPGMPY